MKKMKNKKTKKEEKTIEEAMVKIKGCPKKQKDCANCEIQDCPEEA